MKTTIDLPEALLDEAKRVAAQDSVTLRELFETGLRLVLRERRARATYALPDRRVGGKGLRPELRGRSWDELRELAYGDRR